MKTLKGISDIRRYFYRNTVPTYFISATNFNLLGMDEWVRNFKFINYIDCFDGLHPNVVTPSQQTDQVFNSIEEINNYLLEHKEIADYIHKRGPGGRAVFLFFDDRTEELCQELGLEVCFPPADLRQAMDSKIETTRMGDAAGVPSAPNWIAKITSYEHLREIADHANLGDEVVIQSAYGDSGQTTYFVSNKDDYEKYREGIEIDEEVKVMRKLKPRQAALEACVTRHGTIVGPLMTEIVGFKELTPYKGGWAGNEVFAGAFSAELRDKARQYTFQFGEELRKRGYRGYFEVDYLHDLNTDELYLGEVNPRITGASSMTNLAAFAHADCPLFLFHLLEFSGVDFELDVEELNARWADPENIDSWSQLIIKHTADTVDYITEAPRTGIWAMWEDGTMEFRRTQTHRRTVENEREAFFLRINGAGDYFYKGAELGILVTPGRLMTEDFQLTDRARGWISGIRNQYRTRGLQAAETAAAERVAEVGGFKFL